MSALAADDRVPVELVVQTGGGLVDLGPLVHGATPEAIAAGAGMALDEPLSVTLGGADGLPTALVIRYRGAAVSASRPEARHAVRAVREGAGDAADAAGAEGAADAAPGERPVVVQRPAAYVICLDGPRLLMTENSARTGAPGIWALPGGGLERGEPPADGAARECWEETGQKVEIGALLDVQTAHWVGRSPRGRLEDFHAIRLIFSGRCERPSPPIVHDVGGTTESAAWVDLSDLPGLAMSEATRGILRDQGLLSAESEGSPGA